MKVGNGGEARKERKEGRRRGEGVAGSKIEQVKVMKCTNACTHIHVWM